MLRSDPEGDLMRAVLMFHGVDDSGSVLSVTAAQLSSLVRAVREAGYRILPLLELLESEDPGDAVAFTFDDGFPSLHATAAPIFRDLSGPATLFLTTEYVGKDNGWPTQPADAPQFAMMDWNQLEGLRADGWCIEAHTRTHPDLRRLEDGELEAELSGAVDVIEQRLGRCPRAFAYPYGYYDERVAQFAADRFDWAVTTNFRPLKVGEDRARVPRLDAYYFRELSVHQHFGRRRFSAYLSMRRALRLLRSHPGEIDA